MKYYTTKRKTHHQWLRAYAEDTSLVPKLRIGNIWWAWSIAVYGLFTIWIELNFNDKFLSFAFEEYIKEQILLNPQKTIGFIPTKIGRWWSNKEEIDLVAFNDEKIAFIECKWQNSVNKKRVKEQLIIKSQEIKHNKEAEYFVFTKEDYLNN